MIQEISVLSGSHIRGLRELGFVQEQEGFFQSYLPESPAQQLLTTQLPNTPGLGGEVTPSGQGERPGQARPSPLRPRCPGWDGARDISNAGEAPG